MRRFLIPLGLVASLCLLLSGCIPPCDPGALVEATLLKADSLELMGQAVEPFVDHESEVTALRTRLETALGYNAAKKCNETSTKQWRELLDPEEGKLGAFLEYWKTDGTLGATYIEEAKWIVETSFDQIIRVEEERCK